MANARTDSSAEARLIGKIRAVLYLESQKPCEKMDDDLVAECADFLMELEKRKRLTEKQTKEKINHILGKTETNRKKRYLKPLIVAAILLAVLLAAGAIGIATSGEPKDAVFLNKDKFLNALMGEEVNLDGYVFVKNKISAEYDSIEDFAEKTDLNVLYPAALPEGFSVDLVTVSTDRISYATNDVDRLSIGVSFIDDESVVDKYRLGTTEIINGYECYIVSDNDINQCSVVYENSILTVLAENREDMMFVINNLKES